MLVVFDASTLVGAALRADGVPRRAFMMVEGLHKITISAPVFAEVRDVLLRPKFAAAIAEADRRDMLRRLTTDVVLVEPDVCVTDCRDAKDNKYLELAAAAKADVIVSSDEDLLVLDPWRGIRIERAREFLEMVQAEPRR